MSDIPTIRYCTVEDIRMKAGFEKAANLADRHVQAARRNAQAVVDSKLNKHYTVPFNPVPERIRQLTLKIAAYSLKQDAYGDVQSREALKALHKQLDDIAAGEESITDDEGQNLSNDTGVDGYFGDEPRMFTVGQRF